MDANRIAAAALAVALAASTVHAGEVARVSVTSGGGQGNSSSFSLGNRTLSGDSNFVVFQSAASDLVAGDTNNVEDVFVHDRTTGATIRASMTSSGVQGTRASLNATVSLDGRIVAFDTNGAFVTGDTNAAGDVFVRDLAAGTTTRVSVTSGGGQANRGSLAPALSADGRFVAFESGATNMVSGDSNGKKDVFVHDRGSTTTMRVSVASGGGQGNGDSSSAAIDADGTLVVFESLSTNLVPGDGNGVGDVFVRDLTAGTTTRVSVASDGTQANARSAKPVVSADGRWVAFESTASNLVAGDSNGASDVFVHDRMTATTVRASVGISGTQGSGASFAAILSADGRFVLFESDAPDLVPDDTNATRDVFLHDLATGTTRRMGRGPTQVTSASFAGALSADGRTIVFDSLDHDLVPGDTNNARDVFVETPMCGDGAVDVDETCDDGNLQSGDGCDSNCTPTACGNGVVTDGEDCDDGDDDDTNACPNDCVLLRCGDGVVRAPEVCDDGNLADGDGCDSNCTPTGCGNAIATTGEVCDDGGLVDGDGCDSNCTPTGCGNAIVTTGEVCDDGNVESGDGCDVNCTPTACGNAVTTAGEECDDGNAVDEDGCEADCLLTVCAGGLPIERPILRLVNLGPPFGDEHIVFSGLLRIDRETLAPATDGAQVLIEDRAENGGRLLALTHATAPIPPGRPGSGCEDADGWKSNPPGSRHLYRNRSDAIDPPACTPGSAGGLDSLELEGHGRGRRPIVFRLMARHTTIHRPVGPLRAMLVLGASAEAGLSGRCARHEFSTCDYDPTRTVLICR